MTRWTRRSPASGVDLQAVVDEADLSPSRLLTAAGTFAQSLLSGIANWGVILLAGVFFLTYARTLPRMLSQLAGEGTDVVQRVTRFGQDVRRFMVITAYVGFLTAAVNVPLLLLIGVDFALLWGVLSFLLNFVPNIGFLLSVIPPALLALIEIGHPASGDRRGRLRADQRVLRERRQAALHRARPRHRAGRQLHLADSVDVGVRRVRRDHRHSDDDARAASARKQRGNTLARISAGHGPHAVSPGTAR
ncbi:MAG: AI-2E family transporter [Chloroflexi bacterium]|nr:AI-2E family transporter [Chloroflexota bacterium]